MTDLPEPDAGDLNKDVNHDELLLSNEVSRAAEAESNYRPANLNRSNENHTLHQ
jgi:hypothetical protein